MTEVAQLMLLKQDDNSESLDAVVYFGVDDEFQTTKMEDVETLLLSGVDDPCFYCCKLVYSERTP